MMDDFEQNFPDASLSLDVCQTLEEDDLRETCKSIIINFVKNVINATNQIVRNLQIEWDRALALDRTLSTPEVSRRKNELEEDLLNVFQLFVIKCKTQALEIINDLPKMSQVRRDYNSKLNSFNDTLRAHVLNESDSTRMTLAQLERDKDYLRVYHNELLINHNSRILNLQLDLDNFKQGIVYEQNDMIFLYKKINEFRSLYTFPGETLEQKLARDKVFNSWKEILKLPSNWFEEVGIRQEIVPPSSSEREFNVPSPDLSGINIPSTSRLDQINIPPPSVQRPPHVPSPTFAERSESPELETNMPSPPVQRPPHVPSPTFAERSESPELETNMPSPSVQRSPHVPSPIFTQSSESSSLGVDAFRPRSTIGDSPLHRKHIDNENLLRRIKRSYWKARNEIEFYVRSDPFSNQYQEIQELNSTIQNLSREWRTIQATVQDDSTRRNEETGDRERDETRDEERIGRPTVERTSIRLVHRMYDEWKEATNDLKTYLASFDNDWIRIDKLQRSLDDLYVEIERNSNNEQLPAAEETIYNDLIILRRKIRQMEPEIRRLRAIIFEKREVLSRTLGKLRQNLQQRKDRLKRKIQHSQNARE